MPALVVDLIGCREHSMRGFSVWGHGFDCRAWQVVSDSMNRPEFTLLTATLDDEQWRKTKPNFEAFQQDHPDGVVFVAAGIWIIDRTKAEIPLTRLTEQLHRLAVPFVVVPLSSPPTIAAEENGLQLAHEIGLSFYPMPFAK